MTAQKILESVQRADEENNGQLSGNSHNFVGEASEESHQELTDADYELIESFLEDD